MKTKATEQWKIDENPTWGSIVEVQTHNGSLICEFSSDDIDTAKQIVRDHNAHDALVDALEDLLGTQDLWAMDEDSDFLICHSCGRKYPDDEEIHGLICPADDCPRNKARAALAKARGE